MTQGPNGGEQHVWEMTRADYVAHLAALLDSISTSLEEFRSLTIIITGDEGDAWPCDQLTQQIRGSLAATIDRLAADRI